MSRPTESALFRRALQARRESTQIEFKKLLDPGSDGDVLEFLKDLVAMANSGGGAVVIGVTNVGEPSGEPVKALLELDSAKLTDRLFKYTGEHFADYRVQAGTKGTNEVAVIEISAAVTPLVFTKPGTYAVGSTQQKTAFSQGTVYWRHGAKSEPAVGADLARFIDRSIEHHRKSWLHHIRRVMQAPLGSQLAIVEGTAPDEQGRPTRLRITDDPDAPVFGRLSPDDTHPHRQKELIREVNARLPVDRAINSYDIHCARVLHKIDEKSMPRFAHKPRFGSMQYSDEFVDWLCQQYEKDGGFFTNARRMYFERPHTEAPQPPQGEV